MVWTKWSYMDHWVTETPQGPQPPSFNRAYMDRYIKQLSALGFTGFDTFFFYLPFYAGMYGGVPGFERFLQDNGFDKITGIFSAYPSATKYTAPHVRETHDRIVADCTNTLRMCEGLTGVENFIVMPTSTYYQTEPVTDDTIKVVADLWNRVGKLTLEQGMKTTCHFEFWGAIRTREQLDTFFRVHRPGVRPLLLRHRAAHDRRRRPDPAVPRLQGPLHRLPLQGHEERRRARGLPHAAGPGADGAAGDALVLRDGRGRPGRLPGAHEGDRRLAATTAG